MSTDPTIPQDIVDAVQDQRAASRRRSATSPAMLAMLLASALPADDVPRNRARRVVRRMPSGPTPPRRRPRIKPAPLRIIDKSIEDAKALDQRVFLHRETGEIRAAAWTDRGIVFCEPKSERVFTRPYRKALEWCAGANDITDLAKQHAAELPPEIPAQPIAEEAAGGGS